MLMFLVVAIPPDFELENYLSIAESAGILKKTDHNYYSGDEKPQLDQLKLIAQSLRSSPITCLTTDQISEASFYYLKGILTSLGLLVDERIDRDAYVNTLRARKTNEGYYEEADSNSHVFICCNITNLPKIDNYEKILQNIVNLEAYKINPELTA